MRYGVLSVATLATAILIHSAYAQEAKTVRDFKGEQFKSLPPAKKLLDEIRDKLKSLQGNEGSVTIKSAQAETVELDKKTWRFLSGKITVEIDLHYRQRVTRDNEFFGLPGIVVADRHDTIIVEFDIKDNTGKARIAKGPVNLPGLPAVDWALWIAVPVEKK